VKKEEAPKKDNSEVLKKIDMIQTEVNGIKDKITQLEQKKKNLDDDLFL